MLRAQRHHREHLVDEFERYIFVEEIGHAVYEYALGFLPVERLFEALGVTADVGENPLPEM